MNEPCWVEKKDCLHFHEMLLARFGGISGIRDESLLDSALSKPINCFHYEDATLFEMTAAYAVGIVKNHPFLDGNKRTGFITAAFFIESNGYIFSASEPESTVMTLELAAGGIGKEAYAEWLRENSTPSEA